MKISHQMCQRLISIAVLQARFPDVLSSFETETVQTVKDRALGLLDQAETTAVEWQVVETAWEALRRAQGKMITQGARRGLRVDVLKEALI